MSSILAPFPDQLVFAKRQNLPTRDANEVDVARSATSGRLYRDDLSDEIRDDLVALRFW